MINVAKKGYRGEVQVLDIFKSLDLQAIRAWGSDGRSILDPNGIPYPSDVDIVAWIDDMVIKVQVKRRKKIASYLDPKNCDMVAIRQDRGMWVFLLNEATLKDLIRLAQR